MSGNHTYNDKELLLRTSAGDERAFEELVVLHRPHLLAYITTFTKSVERAEEVVQDVFLHTWLVRGSLKDIRDFRSFLFVISKNLALNAVRSVLRERSRNNKWHQAQLQEEAAPTTSPYEILDVKTLFDQAIALLPPQQQQAWVAVRRQGKKLDQVAQEMNLSKATVKKYIWYANNTITAFLRKRAHILLAIAFFSQK